MGKSGKDWKRREKDRRGDRDDMMGGGEFGDVPAPPGDAMSDARNARKATNTKRKDRRERSDDPIAKFLCDFFANEARNFIDLSPKKRRDAMDTVFRIEWNVAISPEMGLGPDADELRLFQVERTVRTMREDRNRLLLATATIVVTDRRTGLPRYVVKCSINKNDVGNVKVYPQDPATGPVYSNAVWKDIEPKDRRDEDE